jgi:hypothetical protein
MSAALASFMGELTYSIGGGNTMQITIICDNAKRTTWDRSCKRRIPNRSQSSPLTPVSRWISASRFDFNSVNQLLLGCSRSVKDNGSRWESISGHAPSPGPKCPKRTSSGTGQFVIEELHAQQRSLVKPAKRKDYNIFNRNQSQRKSMRSPPF